MVKKDTVKQIIVDFHQTQLPDLKQRELTVPVDTGKVISIIGVRRSGKTYLLYGLMEKLRHSLAANRLVYINFEDERLDFERPELDLILQAYRELYPGIDLREVYFFFDEIQNVDGWDRFVRRVHDSVSRNIFITGSNSKLLSKEIATSLRGRTLTYEIFPLSFREYLDFLEMDWQKEFYSSEGRAIMHRRLEEYLRYGGFPELLRFENNLKDKVLQDYYDTMLFRDLVERYNIKQIHILKYFIKRLMASVTKDFSVNKIYNELKSQGLKLGKGLLYEFLDAVESIYLMFVLNRYSPSVVKQEMSEKKIYSIDNGLLNAVTFKFSKDTGKLLENMVGLDLLRQGKEIFFYRNRVECDFVVTEREQVLSALQVCLSTKDIDTREREIRGLVSACKKFNLDSGSIITLDEEEEFKTDGIQVNVVPAHKYLLKLVQKGK